MPGKPSAGSAPAASAASRQRSGDPFAAAEHDGRRPHAPSALDVGRETLDDRVRAEVDPQPVEVQPADFAGGVEQGGRGVHAAALEQDRLAQAADVWPGIALLGDRRDRQARRVGRGRWIAQEDTRVGRHAALRCRLHDVVGERRGVSFQTDDDEGEAHSGAEFGLKAPELRLGRPRPWAIGIR
jgi:hypothetical protein